MAEIVLRRLRPGDERTFHAMAVASWLDAYRGLLPQDQIESAPTMITRAMAERFDKFMVAFEGERAIGYYSLGDTPEDQNYLWHLYVDPPAQRHGVGSLLHAAALGQLRARGSGFANLDYVAGNKKASRFYARHGWIETGRTINDGLEFVLMQRPL